MCTTEEVERERKEKAAALEAARARKAKAAAMEAERERQASINPADLFKGDATYSKFDENGIPTHNAAGEPLAKKAMKKLTKKYNAQKKKYEKWLAKQAKK